MTNKPMLSVERELLERILDSIGFGEREELRAILDNQVLESQYDGMTQAQAQAVSDGVDEILHGKTAQPYQRCTILKECNVKSSPASGARINSIAKPITRRICHGCVGLPRDVFCPVCDDEQPATVADHPQCEECKGWGYHENHHEGGGTECGECSGSGKAPVEQFSGDTVVCRRYQLEQHPGQNFYHYDLEPVYGSVPVTVSELITMVESAPVAVVMPDVDELAQIIRKVSDSHTLGAGSLAEAILEEVARLNGVKT